MDLFQDGHSGKHPACETQHMNQICAKRMQGHSTQITDAKTNIHFSLIMVGATKNVGDAGCELGDDAGRGGAAAGRGPPAAMHS